MKKLACRPFRTASFAWLALNLATVHNPAVAQTPKPTATSTDTLNLALETPETITIFGKHRDFGRVAGSAHQISSETLTDFEYDDIGRALAKVPGVYIRDEDGFGLRPNIGLRGANSDRSSRVVLLEDGILLGPAPYAAPAAYYVPLFTRMEGVEIFKGPASIQHGPYTVGGAINMMTAQIPVGHAAMGDVALGQFGHGKAHARYGWGGTNFGFLLEGVHLASNGFKELDQDEDADTGFTRNDVMVKFRVNSSPSEAIAHRLDLKFGYGDEASNETYLGLTDDDFAADPLRRYRGSQLARMEWRRFLYEARYSVAFDDDAELQLTAYRHDFTRAWLKLNRFRNLSGTANTPVESVLRDPTGNNELLLRMARGEVSSEEIFSFENVPNLLGIGTNDRTFVSQGVQLDGDYEWNHGSWTQRITAGVRLHYDEIQRRHDEAPYEMVVAANEISTVRLAGDIAPTLTNDESALAFSTYLHDEITIGDLILTPGLRTEFISTRSNRLRADNPNQNTLTRDDFILIPGIGAYYQMLDSVGVLAGAHRGFSPVAPGQFDDIEPETSWSYEAGFRFNRGRRNAEIVGFFSDYSNFLVTCTFSSGCPNDQVGQQFNAASIDVYGIEAAAHIDEQFGPVSLSLTLVYTLTLSSFQNGFSSGSPQFENVEEGDELPYLPVHQAATIMKLTFPIFGIDTSLIASYVFIDRMRNRASQGDVLDIDLTEAQHIVDSTLQVDITRSARFYIRGDNILNQQVIVSRRPFGARPGKPLQIQAGFTYRFGDR